MQKKKYESRDRHLARTLEQNKRMKKELYALAFVVVMLVLVSSMLFGRVRQQGNVLMQYQSVYGNTLPTSGQFQNLSDK